MSLGVLRVLGWLLPEPLRSLFLVCVGLQLFSWSMYWLPSQGIELAALLGAASSDSTKLAADSCRLSRLSWLGYWTLLLGRLVIPASLLPPWVVTVLGWMLIGGLVVLPSSWWLGHKGQLDLSS